MNNKQTIFQNALCVLMNCGIDVIKNYFNSNEKNKHVKTEMVGEKPDIKAFGGEIWIKTKKGKARFLVEIKKEITTTNLFEIKNRAAGNPEYVLFAELIYPKYREVLKENGINYVETNGNIYFRHRNIYINIEGKPRNKQVKEQTNRAFAKAGLKLLFYFLTDTKYLDLSHRELAKTADTALGNITYILQDLKKQNYIAEGTGGQLRILNYKQLLDIWVKYFNRKLRNELHIGNFTTIKKDELEKWQEMSLKEKLIFWGGEPAAYKKMRYMLPGKLQLYTYLDKNDLIQTYRIVPDEKGLIECYKAFWPKELNLEKEFAPAIIIYADLLNEKDARAFETAGMIYERYISQKL